MTREQWLLKLAEGLEKTVFSDAAAELPKYRVTCGFPSKGGLAAKKRTIGQCWSPKASNDHTTEIIISITQDEPMTVAGVLAHEMVHAAVGTEAGHGPIFRRLALAIGLTGKMTAQRRPMRLNSACSRSLTKSANTRTRNWTPASVKSKAREWSKPHALTAAIPFAYRANGWRKLRRFARSIAPK